MEKEALRNQFTLHLIVFILGFTAVLGKLIILPAPQLVWYRTLFACGTIFLMILFAKGKWDLHWKVILRLAGIGVIVAAHWITFFHAIKVSNIAVTLGCLSTTTLFTSFIEPLSQRRRISWLEVVTGLVIIGGILMIYSFETRYTLGILFSLLAALLASTFSVLNKNISLRYDIRQIAFWEMLSGFVAVSLYLLIAERPEVQDFSLKLSDALYLVLLATVCTAFAFTQTIQVMKKLSAYAVVLAINLEPVYGIIMGFLIFGDSERMTLGFYGGAAVILLAVFLFPVMRRKLASAKQ